MFSGGGVLSFVQYVFRLYPAFSDGPGARKSDTPRKAGGLMSWAASKAVVTSLGVAPSAPNYVGQNCPLLPSATSCSRMYWRTCSNSNPTVDTA